MSQDIKVASIYASTEFRIDKESWKQLGKFEARIQKLKKDLSGINKAATKSYTKSSSKEKTEQRKEIARQRMRDRVFAKGTMLRGRMSGMGMDKGQQREWRQDFRRLVDLYKEHGSVARFNAEVSNLNRNLSKQSTKVKSLNGRYRDLRRSLINLTGAYSIFQAVGGIAETGKQAQRADTLFQTMFGAGSAAEMQFLRKETDRLGMNLLDSAKQYAKFSFSAQKAGMSLEEMREIYSSMSEAAVVFGTTTADQEGIFKALTQMLSKGTVSMEELKQQLGDRLNLLTLWLVTTICKFA